MSSFHEVLFPVDVSYGSGGGPKFKTFVFAADSGFEQRIVDWTQTRAEYDVSYGIKDQAQMDVVIAFHWTRRGRAYAFRYKDWNDYKLNGTKMIGTGDAEVQITKTYTSGQTESSQSWTYVRKITKPAWGTISGVTVNGVVKTSPADYTVDYTTGIMTFTVAPADGDEIVIGSGEFHVPVRFDDDHLAVKHEFWNTLSWDSIPLIEDRTDWDSFFVTDGDGGDGGGDGMTYWIADFRNGTYTLNGASATADDLFTDREDPFSGDYTWDSADVVSGYGLTPVTSPPKADPALTPEAFDLVKDGATYVIEFTTTADFAVNSDEAWVGMQIEYTNGDGVFYQLIWFWTYTSSDPTDHGFISLPNPSLGVHIPPVAPGDHKLAVTLSADRVAMSIDGGELITVDNPDTFVPSFVSITMEASNNATPPGDYISKITAMAPQEDADLITLSGGTEGGGGGTEGYDAPDVGSLSDTTYWIADFENDAATVSGVSATFDEFLGEDLDWGSFDPATHIQPGAGLGLHGGSPVVIGEALTAIKDGVTFVVEATYSGSGGFLWAWFLGQDSSQSIGAYMQDNFLGSSRVELYNDSDDVSADITTMPLTGRHKIAMTMHQDLVAYSIDGGDAVSVGPITGTWVEFAFAGFSSDAVQLHKVTALNSRVAADLPALSS